MFGRPLALLLLLVGSALVALWSLSGLPSGPGVPAAGAAQASTPSPTPGVIWRYSEYNDTIASLCPVPGSAAVRGAPTTRPRPAATARATPGATPRAAPLDTATPTLLTPDPLQQTGFGQTPIPTPLRTFDGLSYAQSFPITITSSSGNPFPADASGAIGFGANGDALYFQTVNFAYQIYNGSGTVVCGPGRTQDIWASFPTTTPGTRACRNFGFTGIPYSDVVVLFDKVAQRWFISRFAQDLEGPNATNLWYQCFAISTTQDPLGSYYRYTFQIDSKETGDEFNDYPKFGVWVAQDGSNNAYFMNSNADKIFGDRGVIVAAFERAMMLTGQPAKSITQMVAEPQSGPFPPQFMMLPADLDGRNLPPAGSPAYYVESQDLNLGFPRNALKIWAFQVNWTSPGSSTFNPIATLPTAYFNTNLCGEYHGNPSSQACIPQPHPPAPTPTATRLDPIAYGYIMYRLAYRNFGDHEAIVLNQTVDAGDFPNHAGVRWYELRRSTTPACGGGSSTGVWCIFQAGTYAPDANHRWQGSIAMDAAGNIALGFNAGSLSLFPSIRYVGRQAGSAPGLMTYTEGTLQAGGGSQIGAGFPDSPDIFWADWSQMTVDPQDDCTFWHVGQYYQTTQNFGWNTSIGSFRFPSCQTPTPTPSPTPLPSGTPTPTIHPATLTAIALTPTATPLPATRTVIALTPTLTIHPATLTAIALTPTPTDLPATQTITALTPTPTDLPATQTITALTPTATHLPATRTVIALTQTSTPVVVPTAPLAPPSSGTPGIAAATSIGQVVQYAAGSSPDGVSGAWRKTGSGTFAFTATNGNPAIVPGSIPALTLPTTAANESGRPLPGAFTVCAAVGATAPFTTTCQGTTVGDVLLGARVTVTFALLGGGTTTSVGQPVVAAPTASPTPGAPQVQALLPPPPPLLPPALPPFLPPAPPPLLPVPPSGTGPPAPADVPVIPEAESLLLVGLGLGTVALLARRRRRRRR